MIVVVALRVPKSLHPRKLNNEQGFGFILDRITTEVRVK